MSLCTGGQGTWYGDQGRQHSAKRPPVKPSSMLWWLENQQIHAHLSFLLLPLCSKHNLTFFSQSFFFLCQPLNTATFLSVCAGHAWRQEREEVTWGPFSLACFCPMVSVSAERSHHLGRDQQRQICSRGLLRKALAVWELDSLFN